MRRLTNAIFVLGTLAFLGGVVALRAKESAHEKEIEHVAESVRRFELVIKYHAATNEVELTGRGWPTTVNPDWFTEDPPTNTLLTSDRPWVEIASSEQADLQHPPNRVANDATVAMFWYNPYQGVIRTRIPPMISDQRSVELYNRLNRCSLPSIFATERPSLDAGDLIPASEPDTEESPDADEALESDPNAKRTALGSHG